MEKQNEFFIFTNGCKEDDGEVEALVSKEEIQYNIPCRRRVSFLLNTLLVNSY